MKRVYCITSAWGIGKSTALATFPPPSEIDKLLVLDTEDSMSDLLGMGFKHVRMYDRLRLGGDILERLAKGEVPWVDERGRSALVGYYKHLVKILDKELTLGKYRYLGIDTVEPIEASMQAAVEDGRHVFGWKSDRSYGKMEIHGVRPLYEGLLEAIAQRGVEYIVLTSHLRTPWVKVGPKESMPLPDKVMPGGRLKVLAKLSSAMFWLVQGDDPDGAPAAIVLKARAGRMEVVNDKWKPRRVLPRRIPAFSWDAFNAYKDNPANLVDPPDGERLKANEQQMISKLLTDEQWKLMILSAEQYVQQKNSGGMLTGQKRESVDVLAQDSLSGKIKVTSMIVAGKSNAEIRAATGASLPEIIRARKRLE